METNDSKDKIKKKFEIENMGDISNNKVIELLKKFQTDSNFDKESFFELLKTTPALVEGFKETLKTFNETISHSKQASDESKKHFSSLTNGLIGLLSNPNMTENDKDRIFSMISEINVSVLELDKRDRESFGKALVIGGTLAALFIMIIDGISGGNGGSKLAKTIISLKK